jgi:hypothetical protein
MLQDPLNCSSHGVCSEDDGHAFCRVVWQCHLSGDPCRGAVGEQRRTATVAVLDRCVGQDGFPGPGWLEVDNRAGRYGEPQGWQRIAEQDNVLARYQARGGSPAHHDRQLLLDFYDRDVGRLRAAYYPSLVCFAGRGADGGGGVVGYDVVVRHEVVSVNGERASRSPKPTAQCLDPPHRGTEPPRQLDVGEPRGYRCGRRDQRPRLPAGRHRCRRVRLARQPNKAAQQDRQQDLQSARTSGHSFTPAFGAGRYIDVRPPVNREALRASVGDVQPVQQPSSKAGSLLRPVLSVLGVAHS